MATLSERNQQTGFPIEPRRDLDTLAGTSLLFVFRGFNKLRKIKMGCPEVLLDKAAARNYIRDVISENMDKVQASILMFVLMGIVIILTILSVRKKRPAHTEPTDQSLKQKYEKALKEGDRQAILKLGRAYYSTLSKDKLPLQEDSSNEQYAPKPNG